MSDSQCSVVKQQVLKVNEECNVVTAYKNVKGEWKPIRAMLCSTGLRQPGKETPRGTFILAEEGSGV